MFLIEYIDGYFINGETIGKVQITSHGVSFMLAGDSSYLWYDVDPHLAERFINNLQAMNKNNYSLEKGYQEVVLNKPTKPH